MKNHLYNSTISVIVPVYNTESYINQCIGSIISQTYTDLEIILIDDGSTDQSGELCDKYSQIDSRIHVIHQKNSGPTNARKSGLNIASGKYIGFIDADDYIEKGMYQKLYTIAEEYHADFVHSGYYEDSKDTVFSVPTKTECYTNKQDKEKSLTHLFSLYPDAEMCAAIWPNLFEKKFVMDNYNKISDSQKYGEDLLTMCLCIINANIFVSISEGFYHYRTRANSISSSVSEERLLEYYQLYTSLKKILKIYGFEKAPMSILKKRFSMLAIQDLMKWNSYYIPKYKYPQIDELKNKKIVLYGSGKVGVDYYNQICRYQYCNIISWVDREKKYFEYAIVENISSICEKDYDIIIIAVFDEVIADKIKEHLVSYGISIKNVIWRKPKIILD